MARGVAREASLASSACCIVAAQRRSATQAAKTWRVGMRESSTVSTNKLSGMRKSE